MYGGFSGFSKSKHIPLGLVTLLYTLFGSENERQKTRLFLIPLPGASGNFPDVKTRNEKKFYNWISDIIQCICFGKHMDRIQVFFFWNTWDYFQCPIIKKKLLSYFDIREVSRKTLGSGIGTGLVFCLSFSVSNNVYSYFSVVSKKVGVTLI